LAIPKVNRLRYSSAVSNFGRLELETFKFVSIIFVTIKTEVDAERGMDIVDME